MKPLIRIFILWLMPCLLTAQVQDDFLPKTIIFKVKDDYRKHCQVNDIHEPSFQNIAGQIGIHKLEKIFPGKQKPLKQDAVDLSLIYELNYTANDSEQEVIRKLTKLSIFEYVELYILPQLAYTPNDSDAVNTSRNWHLTMINAFQAWDVNQGDTNVVIGITDTGWDPTHIDLQANCKVNYNDPINGTDDDNDGYIDNYLGWDLGDDDNDATLQTSSHGSHVTGLAAAVTDNVAGVASIGFNTKFLPVKIANSSGILNKAYQGVVYAADQGCFIINCSWGSYTPGAFQRDVIDYAINDKGCLVIGACGNDDIETQFYPAAYDGVLTVAASEQSDLKKNNSNHGYYVDISAPGEAMWSTKETGTWGFNGGTSMAAPVVAGAAALVKSQFPGYTNQQVAAQLRATAFDFYPSNPGYVDKLGSGRLDVFQALTNTSAQFVALTDKVITDNNDQLFENGDTLTISGTFTNYLSALNGLTVMLSSTSPFVSVVDGTTTLPNLTTLASTNNSADPFKVELLTGAGLNQEIEFKAEITNGTYTKNEYFTVVINPDYIHVEENLISTTITSKGKIGHNDVNNSVGLGFYYRDEQLLYEAGLMVGDATTRVADCVRAVSSVDQDFTSLINVNFNPPYVSALDLKGVMNDGNLALPMELNIEQKSYAYANAPDDKYVIITYTIENAGTATLNNLYLGIFADWDIQDAYANKAGYDASRKMGYVHSLASDTVYAAIQLLSGSTSFNYSLDNINGGGGGVDMSSNNFTTDEKYQTLSSNRLAAGAPNGQDVAHVVSAGGFSLNPGEQETIAFALLAGDSLTDLQISADAAQSKYNVIGVEELATLKTVDLYPNPTKGMITVQSKEEIQKITLKNSLGVNIQEFDTKYIDLSTYANGIYFIHVVTQKSETVQKIVLSK